MLVCISLLLSTGAALLPYQDVEPFAGPRAVPRRQGQHGMSGHTVQSKGQARGECFVLTTCLCVRGPNACRALMNVYGTLGSKGTTRDDMQSLAHFTEFNDLIGLDQVAHEFCVVLCSG